MNSKKLASNRLKLIIHNLFFFPQLPKKKRGKKENKKIFKV